MFSLRYVRQASLRKRTIKSGGWLWSRTQLQSLSTASQKDSIFWCGQVVFRDEVAAGSVCVQNGQITACHRGQTMAEAQRNAKHTGATFWDLGENNCLSPGLVDVHVHISALGRDWEGYETATKAAAAGGITTIIGMPLNSLPPTTSEKVFALEKETANEGPLFVDVGLWGGVVPGNCNADDLNNLLSSGVLGLKAFLSPLPPAAGYEAVSSKQLLEAAKICGQHGKPILVHAELMTESELQEQTEKSFSGVAPSSYLAHLNSRPPEWEQAAVASVCKAASYCHMHVVHLSDAGCLDIIRKTKADKSKSLSIETCPHYLLLDSSMTEDGNTLLKCFPPIRDPRNREILVNGLKEGLIDIVASDHSPCESSMRCLDTGNMREAWGGLAGLQYQLPATWTAANESEGFSVFDVAKWWSKNPCALAGLGAKKGSIEVGKQADLCLWNPAHEGAPNEYSQEYHRWKGDTYYASHAKLKGRVLGTWVNGLQVYNGESDEHHHAAGSFLEAS